MTIALCSVFRNSEPYLARYFDQAAGLSKLLEARGDHLRFNLAEGDSTDRTFDLINARLMALGNSNGSLLIKREHGGPLWASVPTLARMVQISWVWNGIWEKLLPGDDIVVFVESDLIWEPQTLLNLIQIVAAQWCDRAETPPGIRAVVDAVAPMVWFQSKTIRFYDTWGFRRNGIHFWGTLQPCPEMDGSGKLLEIDSAGSCIVMTGQAARSSRFEPGELAVRGLCQGMRKAGYRLWVDPTADVMHP